MRNNKDLVNELWHCMFAVLLSLKFSKAHRTTDGLLLHVFLYSE